ncbi:hypothetical protein EGW08_021832 [Elysia chlorotica]|uniref:Uncharacterized protein n=1 Tax=Elysia chlorotica TaxID=188477 RepID=A0A3S1AYD3_ELYCH|nr:hypothetical protein EGW08_021832 [Elysia chlorotica]
MAADTKEFNKVVDIPFPEVPPTVKSKHTVQEQIDEMRLWFKAFKEQDHSVRDYRKYFKPNLCYLEGGWTLNAKTLDEPFQSDRHQLDATSWFDLQEKIRWTSYAGSKSNLENFAFLPTMMYNITDGLPQYAQWNYRILCHPLKQDVPTSYLKVQDDLSTRMRRKYRWDKIESQRSARYKINEFGTERNTQYTFLDALMAEIPGKDNYGANISDAAFGLQTFDISKSGNVPLNAGHYHRWYKVARAGAMGLQSLGDKEQRFLCFDVNGNSSYVNYKHNLSLDPLFNLSLSLSPPLSLSPSLPPSPSTPVEFYHGDTSEHDAADTARSGASVLDAKGDLKRCAPTGFRILTPNIDGVGSVRIRYPVFPVHSEGSTVGMELEVHRSHYTCFFVAGCTSLHVVTPPRNPPGLHGHEFTITAAEHKALLNGTDLQVTTSYNLGHNHQLTIYWHQNQHVYYIRKCDDQTVACWDGHGALLTRVRV